MPIDKMAMAKRRRRWGFQSFGPYQSITSDDREFELETEGDGKKTKAIARLATLVRVSNA